MNLASLIKKRSLGWVATVDSFIPVSVATVATVAVATAPDTAANDPDASIDRWCYPYGAAMTGREIGTFTARLEAWLLEYCHHESADQAPTQMVQRTGPNGLRDKAVFTEAVQECAEFGRAQLTQIGKKRLIQIRQELLKVVVA
jgi:hypothetical protein